MAELGIVYGSNDGAASDVANYIASKLGGDILNAINLQESFITEHSKLIFVASTHKVGELQKDFKAKLDIIENADFSRKTLAIVGLGGTTKHADTFCDGIVEFLPHIRGAKLVGAYDDGGYKFNQSLAFINGKFIGLVLDLKADSAWQARVDKWLESIKGEF